MMMKCLKLSHVTKQLDNFLLDDVSFEVPAGSIMGFIGENGAGKTTTIKCILNLMKLDSGTIQIFGLDHKEAEQEIKEQIGVVLDECFFHDILHAKAVDKIMSRIYKGWESDTFFSYIKRFGLPEKKKIKEYSRGMKMKLSIAVALSHGAKLLILDEATSGLDPVVRNEILDVFLDYIQDEEHTILVSSHITGDLEKIADYITFIHSGRVVLSDAKDTLLESYGILKCKGSEFERLDQNDIIGYRKNSFGYEVLVKDRCAVAAKYKAAVMDPATLEDIMLYYVKGEKSC